jgi:hypothetical protein
MYNDRMSAACGAARRAFALATGLAVVAACNAVLGIRELDGGIGVGADAAGRDGPDTLSDAGPAPLEGGPFCIRPPPGTTFCEDFDDPPTQSRWRASTLGRATIAVDDAAALSAPNSLYATFPPSSNGSGTQAWWSTTLQSTVNDVDVQFAVQMKGAPADSQVANFGLSTGYGVGIEVRCTGGPPCSFSSKLVEQIPSDAGPTYREWSFEGPPLGDGTQWFSVDFEVHLAPSPTWARVSYEGQQKLYQQPLSETAGPGQPMFFFGSAVTLTSTAPWTMRFDNIAITTH